MSGKTSEKTIDQQLLSLHTAIPCTALAGYIVMNAGFEEWGKLAEQVDEHETMGRVQMQIRHPLLDKHGKRVAGRFLTSSVVRMSLTDAKTNSSRRLFGFLFCPCSRTSETEWIFKVEDLDHPLFYAVVSFAIPAASADGDWRLVSAQGCGADGHVRLFQDRKGITYDTMKREISITLDSGTLTCKVPPNPKIKPIDHSATTAVKPKDYSFCVDEY